MSIVPLPGRQLDEVMQQVNAWRQPLTGPASASGAYKEWMHFCIALPQGGHVLVNLNVTESRAPSSTRTPRLIALAQIGEWNGSIESFAADQVTGRAGGLSVQLGSSAIEWRRGGFELCLRTPQLDAELRLEPLVLPTLTTSVALGALHWVVVPRLEASGWVRSGERRLSLERALAYHDHNWGQFRWGGDLSWEWGFVHPSAADCPWDLVVMRISDGRRHRTLSQAALLWRSGRLVRTFQNHEMQLQLEVACGARRPFTLPKLAALLAPGTASGVPRLFRLRAAGRGDSLELDFEPAPGARVALPSEADPFGLVLLNETCGSARVRGTTGGDRFGFEGAGMMEFVRG